MQSRIAASMLVTILDHVNIKISSFDKDLNFIDGD